MRSLWPVLLLAPPLLAGPAIVLSRIDRTGLPPYEGEKGRIYILTGEGCASLHPEVQVVLRRPGTGLQAGRLVILEAAGNSAVGRLVAPGEAYPMKGDEALPQAEKPPIRFSPPPAPAAKPQPQSRAAAGRKARHKARPESPVVPKA
ncbi:MAG: hypothetical protein P4L36_15930 [Holophaga sp.]|nr:hypothetical protein [Holophaga sp.]